MDGSFPRVIPRTAYLPASPPDPAVALSVQMLNLKSLFIGVGNVVGKCHIWSAGLAG
jgi:hypothetical protein